jgi:hypothetical protein
VKRAGEHFTRSVTSTSFGMLASSLAANTRPQSVAKPRGECAPPVLSESVTVVPSQLLEHPVCCGPDSQRRPCRSTRGLRLAQVLQRGDALRGTDLDNHTTDKYTTESDS